MIRKAVLRIDLSDVPGMPTLSALETKRISYRINPDEDFRYYRSLDLPIYYGFLVFVELINDAPGFVANNFFEPNLNMGFCEDGFVADGLIKLGVMA